MILKSATCQKYIYKIHSSILRKERWNLTLPIEEARYNDEVVSLASSQVLRWIDEMNGITDADEKAEEIKREIKRIKSEPNSVKNRHAIKKLYSALDNLQYKPDYMCLIVDKQKDYHRACKGFYINGIKYKRLLGTNGGIKNSTIVFVNEEKLPELKRRIANGRDMNKELVTAKLEAYQALTCSASVPVSFPKGIAVVNDCNVSFLSDIVYLTDECDGEPMMEFRKDQQIDMNASDGFGLMLPSLAERWSKELGLDYMVSGLNTRFSFEKGMAFTFDFVDFGEKVAGGNYIVKDAWGNDFDVRDVELILTTSMVKLWDSYKSCEDYVSKSLENGYTFGVAKTCPKELENERCLNYQFIQSYDLDDDDIEELIAPTMNEIKDVLGGDWRKTVLFLKGSGLNEKNIDKVEDDFAKALMINPEMINDPYVQNSVYQLIKNRINQAKVGVLKVHGNYSIISGDPFSLCQSIFGLPVTGLLKAGEIYNKYWSDYGAKDLACFRAPMTCHANVRSVHPSYSEEASYWYQYMNTCTILNSWDTTTAALNGADFDGDIVMLTDNDVLVRKLEISPALMCAQRKAAKCIPTEEDFISSNISSFGNDIGRTTNWITSMFEVRSNFEKESKEYNILSYRIQCGQLYQQNAIDKAKGIICKPMPREWHDLHSANKMENDGERSLYRSIAAYKKPYFMRYIYPSLATQYNRYIKACEKSALIEFGIGVKELESIADENLTDRQRDFLKYYRYKIPVSTGDCVMNKICKRFEQEFDGRSKRLKCNDFDYRIMKSNNTYTETQKRQIAKLYDEYNKQMRGIMLFADVERIDKGSISTEFECVDKNFLEKCYSVCQNRLSLCNLLLDICYDKNSTKRFVWDMCSSEIIHNLLENNNHHILFPVLCEDGDIKYSGQTFTIKNKEVGICE